MLILPEIHALWVGTKLGPISRCCLSSFVMQGHKVFLHTYNKIDDLPDGVSILDANHIIPKNKIFKHKETGSYALFSDVFRYELLKKIDGIYVDCDVYCLKPITKNPHGYILGYEDSKMINGAILALPKDSPALSSLLAAAYDPHFIPPWYSKNKQTKLKMKKMIGIGRHISDMPWGIIGPHAITYFIKNYALTSYVQPSDIFYPVHYQCINQLLDPELNIEDVTTSRTLCVHLYNEMLRDIDLSGLPSTSLLSLFLRNEI